MRVDDERFSVTTYPKYFHAYFNAQKNKFGYYVTCIVGQVNMVAVLGRGLVIVFSQDVGSLDDPVDLYIHGYHVLQILKV